MRIIEGNVEVKKSQKGNDYLSIVVKLEDGEVIYLRTNNSDQYKYLMMKCQMGD